MLRLFPQAPTTPRIRQIRDVGRSLVGIDENGKLYVSPGSYVLGDDCRAEHKLSKLQAFAKDHKIKDICCPWSGSTYVLTDQGLYGFGNNLYGQLNRDTDGYGIDEIVCVYPNSPDNKILRVAYGDNFTCVQSERELISFGKLQFSKQNFFDNATITNIKCGYEEEVLMRCGNQLFSLNKHSMAWDGLIPLFALRNDCKDKQIIDYFVSHKQEAVWCKEGLYAIGESQYGQLGFTAKDKERAGKFTKVGFFNDKTIMNVYLEFVYTLVHCKEGLYVAGMNNVGRLGLGDYKDRREFTRLKIDPSKVTNIQTDSGFICLEVDNQWLMSGTTGTAIEPERHHVNFDPITFEPIETFKFAVANKQVDSKDEEKLHGRVFRL